MKNITKLVGLTLLFVVHAVTAADSPSTVIERGPHHQVSERIVAITDAKGKVVERKSTVVELQTGLNRWDESGKQWVLADATIEIVPEGGVVRGLQYGVAFAANLNAPEAIKVTLPDGSRLSGGPLALAYRSIDQYVVIAEVGDSTGVIQGTTVTYPSVFQKFPGIDVRYVVAKNSFEQFLIIRQKLPPPSAYGLPDTSVLELLTEFVNPPEPDKQAEVWQEEVPANGGGQTRPSIVNDSLGFGGMRMPVGRAFATELQGAEVSEPVAKSWIKIDGRTLLAEQISWQAIKSVVDQLPAGKNQALLKRDAGSKTANSRVVPAARQARAAVQGEMKRMAAAQPAERAFVLDYSLDLTNGLTDFVSDPAATYWVKGPVFLYGTTKFTGGSVFKFAPETDNPHITLSGTVICDTTPYHPVMFLADNDDSMGTVLEPVSYAGYHAVAALRASTTVTGELHDLRFKSAQTAIDWAGGTDRFSNLQIMNCSNGVSRISAGGAPIHNLLATNVLNLFIGSNSTINAQHVTAHFIGTLARSSGSPSTVSLTNSILVSVTNLGTGTLKADYLGTNATPAISGVTHGVAPGVFAFQSSVGGDHYIKTNALLDAGTTNISATLLTELALGTTYPPQYLTYTTTTNTTLSPVATRDAGTPDLGYHFAPLDYIVSGYQISTNVTVTLTNGVAVGVDYGTSIWGFIFDSGNLLSIGSPSKMNRIVRAHCVQERSGGNPGTMAMFYDLGSDGNPHGDSNARFRFTEFSAASEDGSMLYYGTYWKNWELTHCNLWDIGIDFRTGSSGGQVMGVTNCVFDHSGLAFYVTGSSVVHVRNTLFYKAWFNLSGGSTNWTVQDNLFDRMNYLGASPAVFNSHNAYYPSNTVALTGGTSNLLLTNISYAVGALGQFYQPTNSPLLNAGSRNATNAGLYHFTTTTNQVPETNSVVDIGPHYVAVNAQGQPLDSNTNGLPNFVEDANGNGFTDGGESSFTTLSVAVTSATNFTALTTVVLTASASAAYSPVTLVEYFFGTTNFGQSTASPYTVNWASVPAGIYTVTARATALSGLMATSAPVTLYVNNALHIIGTTFSVHDDAVTIRLRSLGFHPLVLADTQAVVADGLDKQLVFISRSASAANLDSGFSSLAVPLISRQHSIFSSLNMTGPASGTDYDITANNESNIVVTLTSNSMAAGLSGTKVVALPGTSKFSWGKPTNSAVNVAYWSGGSTNTSAIFGYEAGAAILNGNTAPARRAGFFFAGTNLNSSGWSLFDATVRWATGTNIPPAINWLLPTNGSSFTGSSNISLSAKATDYESGLKKVNFYRDGVRVGIANSITNSTNSLVWSNVPGGTYFMGAKAIDNGGLSTTTTQLVTLVVRSNVLFVVTNATLNSSESAISNRLATNGFVVSVKSGSSVTTGDADGKSLVLISSSVASNDVNSKFARVIAPVMVWRRDLFDFMGMTATNSSGTNFGTTNLVHVAIPNASTNELMAAGLRGTNAVLTNASSMNWARVGSNAIVAASLTNDPNKAVIFGYEKGDLMVGFGTNQFAAPGRRVGFMLTTNNAILLNSNGWKLFDAAVSWAIQKPCYASVDVILVIDKSQSMTNPPTVFTDAKRAATNFIKLLQLSVDKVGIVSFASNSTLEHKLSQSSTSVIAAVNGITVSTIGGTYIEKGIQTALTELTGTNRNPNSRAVMIVMSDGKPSNTTSSNSTLAAATQAKDAGIRIFSVGFSDAAPALMTAIASTPSDYYSGTDSDDLQDLYNAVADTLCKFGPPVVIITNPVSGAAFNYPSNVQIDATAFDDGGYIAQVKFFNGTNLLWMLTNAPYSFTWTNPAAGSYIVTAVATDNSGLSATSSPVSITVNLIPSVNAGTDQMLVWPLNQLSLAGTAWDDGVPTNGTFTTVWSVVSGPGPVTFGNSGITNTTATFSTNGTYTLRLTANDGAASAYDEMTVRVQLRPVVSITSPIDGAISNVLTHIRIVADASDADGFITNVSFYVSLDLLGTSTTSLYSIVWTNPVAGNYTLTAVATDDSGLMSTSSPVSIAVRQAPTVSIVTPMTNQAFEALANITFSSVAADVDGYVTKVEYFTNYAKFGEAVASPYLLPWKNILGNAPGASYIVTATATDNHGLLGYSSPVVFYVGRQAPVVTITSPPSNTTNAVGEPILVQAVASDADGQITNVQFFVGSGFTTLIAEITNAPYLFLWTNTPSTNFFLQARVYDNDGLSGTSVLLTNFVQSCPAGVITNLSVSTNLVVSGSSLTATIMLDGPALLGGQSIFISNSSAFVSAPSFVLVTQGQSSVSFAVNTLSVGATNVATLTASYRSQSAKATNLTVLPQWSTNAVGKAVRPGFDGNTIADSPTNRHFFSTCTSTCSAGEDGYVGPIATGFPLLFYCQEYSNVFININGNVSFGDGYTTFTPQTTILGIGLPTIAAFWADVDPSPQSGFVKYGTNTVNGHSSFGVTWDNVGYYGDQWDKTNRFQIVLIDRSDTGTGNFDIEFNYDNIQWETGQASGSVTGFGGAPARAGFSDGKYVGFELAGSGVSTKFVDTNSAGLVNSNYNSAVLGRYVFPFRCKSNGRQVTVRNDNSPEYSPFTISNPKLGAQGVEAALFDTTAIYGSVVDMQFERYGYVQHNSGAAMDLELGVASTLDGPTSFGLVLSNLQSSTSPSRYAAIWMPPTNFFGDLQAGLHGLYSLRLTNRLTGLCGSEYVVTDMPHSDWPAARNTLSFVTQGDRSIPQGRCRSFVLDGGSVPANAEWDIVFFDRIVGSSGMPNGWHVEPDYTVFAGYTITVPQSALFGGGYEVRVLPSGASFGRSATFSVTAQGTLNSAPAMLPILLSTNAVATSGSVDMTISLDAPAPAGGAFITLKTNGLAGCTVPAWVLIPSGESVVTTNLLVSGTAGGTLEVLASFNGYRKATIRAVLGGCANPGPPQSPMAVNFGPNVILTWSPVAGAERYNISRGTNATNYSLLFGGIATNRFVDALVTPQVTYYYKITAFSNWCESASNTVSVTHAYPSAAPIPWILPAGGTFNDRVAVLITNFAVGTTTLYYTTNGTQPTTSSDSFAGGGMIILGSNATIRTFAHNTSYTYDSSTVSATFVVMTPTTLSCGAVKADSLMQTNSYSQVRGPGYYASRYQFSATKGDLITVAVSSADFDTVLFLTSQATNLIASNDDFGTSSTDSRIVFNARDTGPLVIEVTSFATEELGAFTLTLSCQPVAEINVLTNAYPTITSNSAALPNYGFIDFGTTNAGGTVTRYLTITNSGNTNLNLSGITILPPTVSWFTVTNSSLSIPANGITNLSINLSSAFGGDFGAYLTFTSNDATNDTGIPENPFYVNLTGHVSVPHSNPVVSIYFPTNGTVIPYIPSSIQIAATASDEDGIKQVEFFTNGVSLGASAIFTNPPYSFIWSNGVTNGPFSLTARATDNSNNVTTSSANVITVGVPTLVLAPAAGKCASLTNWNVTLYVTNKSVSGTALVNSNVTFIVAGANNYVGSATTDPNGVASFTYTGTNYGADRVTVSNLWNGISIVSNQGLFNWAKPLACGDVIAGTLSEADGFLFGCNCTPPSHYTDFYSFVATNAGDVKVLRLSSTSFNNYMVVADTNCQSLTTNYFVNAVDSQIIFTAPSNGTYIVQVSSVDIFQTGSYMLQFTCGLPTNTPDIGVLRGGTNLANGAVLDFGTTTVGTPVTNTIAITNRGTGNLLLSAIGLLDTNYFSILSNPTGPIGPNVSSNLTVRFSAQAGGLQTASLVLTNNDPDSNPFILTLSGIANPAGAVPSVALIAPVNNSTSLVGAPVVISATASASSPATISNVSFFANGVFLGRTTNSPYSMVWSSLSAGVYSLVASATDNSNRTALSSPVSIQVFPNSQDRPPVAVNDSFAVAANSLINDFVVLANDSDPDGDALQIISVTAPGNGGTATIINSGTMIRYTPPRNLAGGDGFRYTISDGRGGISSASVNVKIDATPMPTIAITSPTQQQYMPSGTPFTITTTIAPTQNLTKVEFYLGKVKLGQNTNPPWENFVWNPTTENCDCGLQATATDKYGQVGVSFPPVQVNVTNPANASLPFARIDSPAPIAYTLHGNIQYNPPVIRDGLLAVTGAVYRVQGTTTNTADYKVLITTPDGTIVRESAWFTAAQTTAFALYTNDLTTVRNGVYDLQVMVRSANGLTNAVVRFVLESDLKIGPFSFSELDMVVPVSGLPLTVTRTYSSLNPNIGDFGYSWTYAINDMELSLDEERINKTPLFEDDASSDDGTFSLRVGGGRNVTLTLPDGRRTTFYYYEVSGGCGFGLCALPRYQAAPGITATLRAVDKFGYDLNGYDTLTGSWRSGGGANTAYENFDFPGFVLTMQDGTEFYIQREYKGAYEFIGGASADENGDTFADNFYAETYGKGRLVRIKQRSGDVIKINNDTLVGGTNRFSIDHYNASNQLTRSIFFERDAQKRISAIRDPMSGSNGLPVVKYEYDALGNLVRVLRLVDRTAVTYQTNSYAYENASFPHYLTTIVDGRGKPAARQLYDDQGRLIAIVDASGRTNRFDHNLAAKTETIYDREGNQTVHVYDQRGNITSTTDALGHTMLRAYNTNNYVVQETDPLNNVTRYAYDSLGNRTAVTNASGEVTRLGYNSFSQVLTVLDPLGHGATNGYDAKGNLTNAVNALGQATRFLYDAQARLVSQVDAAGTFTTNLYDALGNLTTMIVKGADGASNFTSYAYDVNGNRTNEIAVRTLPGGGTQSSTNSFFYDGQNRVVTTLDAAGATSRTLYNEIGQVAATVNARGVTNLMAYDERGLLASNIVASGLAEQAVETHAYDGNGRRTATTDRLGRVTQFQYDAVGRMVRTLHADGTTNTTVYDEAGRVTQTVDARGGVTKFGYDAVGRRVATTNALEQTSYAYYDVAGNLSIAADAAGRFVEYEYDVLNRRVKTLFLATVAGQARSAQTVGYDTLGRTVAQTNEAGVVARMGYDTLGRMTAVTNAWGTADATWATYAYDEWGQQTNQVDALGRVTSFEYDKLGRRIKRILPGAQWEGFAYDVVGNLLRHTNFNGRVITNFYDGLNRLVSRWHGSTQLVSMTYNLASQRTALSNESGILTWVYDVRGRVRTNTTPAGTLLYAYDANGNLINTASLTTNGVSVAYEYDVLNRLTNVIDNGLSGVKNTSYGFDEVGNLTALRYPNNVRSEWQYDARNRLTNEVWKLNMSTLAGFAYQVAVGGNRTNLSEVVNGTSRNFAWSYDQQYRLTNEVAGGLGNLAYRYDVVGNRTNRTSSVSGLANQTPTYNTNDWLNSDSYDENGNTTNSASTGYQYDWANRLTNANSGGVVIGYDGNGHRVKKTVSGTTTLYLVSAINPSGYAQVLEELTVSGGVTNLAKVYTYGLDLVSQRVPGTSTNFFGYDGHGSTRFLTDAAGSVANAFAFDAYGTLIASNGLAQTDYLYCRQQFDRDLGMYYQRARYLKTDTGRFLTMDSHEGGNQDPVSLHKYLYVNANPVNLVDPSGHEGSLAELSVGSLINSYVEGGIGNVTANFVVHALLGQRYTSREATWDFATGGLLGAGGSITKSLTAGLATKFGIRGVATFALQGGRHGINALLGTAESYFKDTSGVNGRPISEVGLEELGIVFMINFAASVAGDVAGTGTAQIIRDQKNTLVDAVIRNGVRSLTDLKNWINAHKKAVRPGLESATKGEKFFYETLLNVIDKTDKRIEGNWNSVERVIDWGSEVIVETGSEALKDWNSNESE